VRKETVTCISLTEGRGDERGERRGGGGDGGAEEGICKYLDRGEANLERYLD